MRQKLALTASDAQKMIDACRAEAQANDWSVSIAIVDDGGHLLKFERMDGAGLGTIEAAIQKAKSAALFDGTTKALEDLVLARLTFLNLPGYVPVQGGVPVKIGEDCIGGIGVSGVPSQCDEQIASAGLTVLD
jgi:uncharacterized protein GlcG (DUF336 family)